jgi:hypothetical protein
MKVVLEIGHVYCVRYPTFNNISVILWRSFLLVVETEIPGENHRSVVSHWQTLSHNVIEYALPWPGFELTIIKQDRQNLLRLPMPILIIKSFRTVNVNNKYILYLFIFQILGPMANNSNQLFGLYSADSDPKFTVTPLKGLSQLANNVLASLTAFCTSSGE